MQQEAEYILQNIGTQHYILNGRMDLKIVGAGRLGVRLALLWQAKFPDAKIFENPLRQT